MDTNSLISVQISVCIECSAKTQIDVPEVFYYAQKTVTHPVAPLYNCQQKVEIGGNFPTRIADLMTVFDESVYYGANSHLSSMRCRYGWEAFPFRT
jgi:hypothetical protein